MKCNVFTCLFKALAIDLAILVLPTPGGPWKQRILPCVEPFSLLTAMNSCNNEDNIHVFRTIFILNFLIFKYLIRLTLKFAHPFDYLVMSLKVLDE